MKILVCIANYGTKNDQYLRRLLDEYRATSYDVHVVVLSNVPKPLGQDVEVLLEEPRGDPWSFPFAHKKLFVERLHEYDLFIYSEDDTLITQRSIAAFLEVSAVLPPTEIAGFLRSEQGPDGSMNFSTVHGHFHWDPQSVVSHGCYKLAFFTNEHSACYILTRSQLAQAIESGGFLVAPHQEKYDLLVTAATDPYTQCGFRKLICFSHIRDFILPHLPNKYVGKLGTSESDFFTQIRALEAIEAGTRPCTVLLNVETRLGGAKWSKSYYEEPNLDIMSLVPANTGRLLSYGCGCGAVEAQLKARGMEVTAIPLDSVIGACAEARGIKVRYGNSHDVLSSLSCEQFDCIIVSNVLHLVASPEALLSSLAAHLAPRGVIVAVVPNLIQFSTVGRQLMRNPALRNLTSYERCGAHQASFPRVRRWFRNAGLSVRTVIPRVPERAAWVRSAVGKIADPWLADEFSLLAARA